MSGNKRMANRGWAVTGRVLAALALVFGSGAGISSFAACVEGDPCNDGNPCTLKDTCDFDGHCVEISR